MKQASQQKKLAIIIVAAGSSSRLGQPKQLIKIGDQSLLRRIAKMSLQLTESVSCVIGFDAETIAKEIEGLAIECIINTNWRPGMGSSIAAGVRQLDTQIDAAMILLCDQWALTIENLQILMARWELAPKQIIASCYDDRNADKLSPENVIGVPAIFPRSYFKQLSELSKTGAKKIIMENAADVVKVKLNSARFDLDTPEDLKEFNLYRNSQNNS